MLNHAELPNDIDGLKAMLLAAEQRITVSEGQVADQRGQLSTTKVEIEHLKIAKLWRMQFGRKSEKPDHQIEQLELQLEDLQATEGEAERARPPAGKAPCTRSARKPLPEHLPRDERVYRPEDEACLAYSGGLRQLGEDVAEQTVGSTTLKMHNKG